MGKKYDKAVDFDTLDLFTKRFNSKKKYSDLSKEVFNEINELSEIPIHRTSKKFSKIGKIDLISRLELLGGEIGAGNTSIQIKNKFTNIAHKLRNFGDITNDQLNTILENYIM